MARTGDRTSRTARPPAAEASAGGHPAGAAAPAPTAATAGRSSSVDGSSYTAARRLRAPVVRYLATTPPSRPAHSVDIPSESEVRRSSPMPRPVRPDDMYGFRIATDPRLSPDGRWVAFTVQVSALRRDGYRHALWLVPADGSAPARQVTIGVKRDRHPRFSPDGRSIAFLSDRRLTVEEMPGAADDREDGEQVHLLPLDGGEARRITDLPRGVIGFAWAPDGESLAVLSASRG